MRGACPSYRQLQQQSAAVSKGVCSTKLWLAFLRRRERQNRANEEDKIEVDEVWERRPPVPLCIRDLAAEVRVFLSSVYVSYAPLSSTAVRLRSPQ